MIDMMTRTIRNNFESVIAIQYTINDEFRVYINGFES